MCSVFGLHSEFRNCNFVSIMKIVLIKIFHILFSGSITMSIFIDWAIRLCCGFIWFLTLMCLSWPSAIPAALLYVLTLPFARRSEITRTISNYLLRFVQLPLRCADNIFAMAPLCNTECNGQYAYYLYFALITKMPSLRITLNAFLRSNNNCQGKKLQQSIIV